MEEEEIERRPLTCNLVVQRQWHGTCISAVELASVLDNSAEISMNYSATDDLGAMQDGTLLPPDLHGVPDMPFFRLLDSLLDIWLQVSDVLGRR